MRSVSHSGKIEVTRQKFGLVHLDDSNRAAVVEVETPPLAVSQPKLVQTGVQVCQQRHEVVYEKSDGACTSSRKKIILSHRKASAEPDGIFRQKPLEDYVT